MSTDHRRAARRVSAIAIVLGLLVTILPRVVVPVLRPGRYVDTFHRVFIDGPLDGAKLVAWTALPFIVVAWLGYRLLPGVPAERFQFRYAGLLAVTFVMFLAGIVIHVPSRPGTGFNFGVAFFPFYAAILGGLTIGVLLLARSTWRLFAQNDRKR